MKKLKLFVLLVICIAFGYSLQAQTVLNNNEYLQGRKTDGSTTKLIGISSNNNVVLGSYGQSVNNLYFYNGTSPVMAINAAGSVGFNTTALDNTHYRFKYAGGGFKFYKLNADGSENHFAWNGNADLRFKYGPRGEGGRALVHDGGNRLTINYGNDFTGGTKIGDDVFFGSKEHSLESYINTNLGIGVTAPTTKLEVAGIVTIRDTWDAVYRTNRYGSIHDLIGVYQGWDPAAIYIAGYNSSNNENFATNKVYIGRGARSLNINLETGNVGIGTTNPGSYKLAVEGKIGAREVNVTTAAWADFVFQDDYVLRPLAEVKAFIQQHKHLPEVPSEAEVLENGVDVGAMNAKLLQKIEELTLYTIEQEERLKKKDDEISEILNRLNRLESASK